MIMIKIWAALINCFAFQNRMVKMIISNMIKTVSILKTALLILTVFVTASCSGFMSKWDYVEYEFHSATTPPPTHYEIRLKIAAGGECEYSLSPGYGGDSPVWTESFRAPQDFISKLKSLKINNYKTPGERERRIGGSTEHIKIISGNKTVLLDVTNSPENSGLKELAETLRKLVPEEVKSRLMSKREEYMTEFTRKQK